MKGQIGSRPRATTARLDRNPTLRVATGGASGGRPSAGGIAAGKASTAPPRSPSSLSGTPQVAPTVVPLKAPPPRELQDVLYSKAKGVARITINRPGSYNAYTTSTLEELAWAVQDASFDDEVGVIVLTGAGTKAFCTGGDVKEYSSRYTRRPGDYWKYMAFFSRAVEALLSSGKPTIARLNGMTVGGGNELHLACDLSVAASHIYIGQVGVGVGSVAAGGATQWLTLAVGDRRARRMLFLNEKVPPRRAEEWGLVSAVAPSVRHGTTLLESPTPQEIQMAQKGEDDYSIDLGPLDEAVDRLAHDLLEKFPECLRYTKAQTNFWKSLVWHQTVPHAQEWLSLHFAHPEVHEGMSAFVEKRPARVDDLRDRLARGAGEDYFHGPPMLRCSHCGADHLPDRMRFCGMCGASLSALASPQEEARSP